MSLLRELPAGARALVVGVVVAGLAALVPAGLAIGDWDAEDVRAAVLVALAVTLCEPLRIDVRFRRWSTDFAVDDAVWAAGLLLVRPSVLVVAALAGTVVGQSARRMAPVKVAFNAGQTVLAVSVAVVVFGALGAPAVTDPTAWAAAAAAMAALWLLNTLTMGGFVALLEGRSFGRAAFVPTSILLWLGNVAIGILAALLVEIEPAALPLLAVPLGLSVIAYRAWIVAAQERDWMAEMALDANAISARSDLSGRVHEPADDGAVADLARTLNELLARLAAAFERERRFIRETSHELKTPITIVRGTLEVMDPEPSPLELKETTAVVFDEIDRMSRIVEDMSALARMEDPASLRPEHLELEQLIADVSLKAATFLDDRLEIDVGTSGLALRADRQRLTQALINLLKNARDHTAPGTPVRLRVLSRPDGIRFEVVDRGGGIHVDLVDRVFEPFQARRGSDGSGLGLAIVAGIARAHGGDVGLDNEPGAGATFWVRVPASWRRTSRRRYPPASGWNR